MLNAKCKIEVFPPEMIFNFVREAGTFIQHFAFCIQHFPSPKKQFTALPSDPDKHILLFQLLFPVHPVDHRQQARRHNAVHREQNREGGDNPAPNPVQGKGAQGRPRGAQIHGQQVQQLVNSTQQLFTQFYNLV